MLDDEKCKNPQGEFTDFGIVRNFSIEEIFNAYPEQYITSSECEAEKNWQLLDTFDQELKSAGQMLLRQNDQLILISPDRGIVKQDGCPVKWSFVSDLGDGPVKDGLLHVSPLRACLPIVSLPARLMHCRLLDDEQKTVVRLSLLEFETADESLLSIVQLQRVRGYKKALKDVRSVIARHTAAGSQDMACVWSVLCPHQLASSLLPDYVIDPNAHASQVKTDLIGLYLAGARINEAGVIADWDTEFLHDYRVNLRKVRSVLSLFKGVFNDQANRKLKVAFADLMKVTNRLRDLDVYLLDKQEYLSLVPVTMQPGLDRMFTDFARERKKELNRVKRQLRSEDYQNNMQLLQQQFPAYSEHNQTQVSTPLGPLADAPAGAYANALIFKRYQKIRKLARRVDDETSDAEIHKLRIEFKKLRYLMSFFASLYPASELDILLKSMKALQSCLGRFNDFSVQQVSLNDVVELQQRGKRTADMDIVRSIGALVAAIHKKQGQARQQIADNLDGFISKNIRLVFERLFHSPKCTGRASDNNVIGSSKISAADELPVAGDTSAKPTPDNSDTTDEPANIVTGSGEVKRL